MAERGDIEGFTTEGVLETGATLITGLVFVITGTGFVITGTAVLITGGAGDEGATGERDGSGFSTGAERGTDTAIGGDTGTGADTSRTLKDRPRKSKSEMPQIIPSRIRLILISAIVNFFFFRFIKKENKERLLSCQLYTISRSSSEQDRSFRRARSSTCRIVSAETPY